MSIVKICVLLLLAGSSSLFAQDEPPISEQAAFGTEFVFSMPPCYEQGGSDNQAVIYISAPYETDVRLEIPGRGVVKNVKTVPNDIVFVTFSPGEIQPFTKHAGQIAPAQDVFEGAAVIMTAEQPIMASLAVRYEFTSDATLLMPTASLGNEYVVASMVDMSNLYPGLNLPSETVIAATADDTRVWFTLGGTAETRSNNGMQPGLTREFELQRGDVLAVSSINGGGDLSGSYVRADKPVSVISGNQCANVPNTIRWCDYIVSAEIPIFAWSTSYHVPSITTRENTPYIKIFSAEDNTTVLRDAQEFVKLERGKGGLVNSGYYDGPADAAARAVSFSADKPISIKLYNRGQEDDNVTSDPFAMQLIPVENYVNYLRFHTPGVSQLSFSLNWLTLIHSVDANNQLAEEFEIGMVNNGEIQWQSFRELFGATPGELFASIGDGKTWAQKTVKLPDNSAVYVVRSASDPFMVYLNGNNNYDTYGIQVAGVKPPIADGDGLPPVNEFTLNDGLKFAGLIRDVAEDGFELAGLATVRVLQGKLRNMTFNIDEFERGTLEAVAWTAEPLDLRFGGRVVLEVIDLNGNSVQLTFIYEPEGTGIAVEPEVIDFGRVQIGLEYEREVLIRNTSYKSQVQIEDASFGDANLGYTIVDSPRLPWILGPRRDGSDDNAQNVTIRFSGAEPGTYPTQLRLTVGDEGMFELVDVNAEAHSAELIFPEVDAGPSVIGEPRRLGLEIVNTSNRAVQLKQISAASDPAFQISPTAINRDQPYTLAANASLSILAIFRPVELRDYTAFVEVAYCYDDDVEIVLIGRLRGEGVDPASSVNDAGSGPLKPGASVQPNPASSAVTVDFELLTSMPVAAQLIDVRGNLVLDLAPQEFGAGRQALNLDVSGLAVGSYYCQLEAGGSRVVLPIVVRR